MPVDLQIQWILHRRQCHDGARERLPVGARRGHLVLALVYSAGPRTSHEASQPRECGGALA
jgi:hypothetical protein